MYNITSMHAVTDDFIGIPRSTNEVLSSEGAWSEFSSEKFIPAAMWRMEERRTAVEAGAPH